ncbi:MAG: glycosyltransferase family 4 protein [Blastocatellia bacterium]
MRIGVDACCWGNKRGFGRFTRELLDALLKIDEHNEYLFFIDSETKDLGDMPSRVTKVIAKTEHSQVIAASADGRRSLSDIWSMSREVWKHKIDVFFFPSVYSYFPILNRTKVVLTIHDVIAEHHPGLIFPNSKSQFFWKIKQRIAIGQANLIATVSEYSKKEIKEYFGLQESRMRIISEAARPVFKVLPTNNGFVTTLANYQLHLGERFLLYVGGISPHKNLNTLIEAFKRIVDLEPNKPLKLILVGDYKDDPFFSAYPKLKEQVANLGLDDKVAFTGFIPDEDLAYLYNAATLLVFPSLEEGFGLPAIEAMACGTPVAASNTGSLPEVLGHVGRFFDPTKVGEMAEVIRNVLSDEPMRQQMKTDGLKRSQNFLWKKAAEDTLAIFNELGGH